MDEVTDEVVLDAAATPGGEYELLAYRAKGTTWIGYRPKGWPSEAKGSAVQGSIGLHTGSREHALEVTASLHGTWGLAFGGVAPEIERVAVRNERGEVFPAKIIPLPGPTMSRSGQVGAWQRMERVLPRALPAAQG